MRQRRDGDGIQIRHHRPGTRVAKQGCVVMLGDAKCRHGGSSRRVYISRHDDAAVCRRHFELDRGKKEDLRVQLTRRTSRP